MVHEHPSDLTLPRCSLTQIVLFRYPGPVRSEEEPRGINYRDSPVRSEPVRPEPVKPPGLARPPGLPEQRPEFIQEPNERREDGWSTNQRSSRGHVIPPAPAGVRDAPQQDDIIRVYEDQVPPVRRDALPPRTDGRRRLTPHGGEMIRDQVRRDQSPLSENVRTTPPPPPPPHRDEGVPPRDESYRDTPRQEEPPRRLPEEAPRRPQEGPPPRRLQEEPPTRRLQEDEIIHVRREPSAERKYYGVRVEDVTAVPQNELPEILMFNKDPHSYNNQSDFTIDRFSMLTKICRECHFIVLLTRKINQKCLNYMLECLYLYRIYHCSKIYIFQEQIRNITF